MRKEIKAGYVFNSDYEYEFEYECNYLISNQSHFPGSLAILLPTREGAEGTRWV